MRKYHKEKRMPDYKEYLDALLRHHDDHERVQALFEINGDLTPDVFWKLFKVIWRVTSVMSPHQELLRRMLTSERVNGVGRIEAWTEMDFEWAKRAVARNKPMKIYRGGSTGFGLTGFCWTTNYERAARYAERTGFPHGVITVGRIDPSLVMLWDDDLRDVFVFPDHVKNERHDNVMVKDQAIVREAQLRALAGLKGAAAIAGLTPGMGLRDAIEKGRRNKEKAIKQLEESRAFLQGLGFKQRLGTIDNMLVDIADAEQGTMDEHYLTRQPNAVRSAE